MKRGTVAVILTRQQLVLIDGMLYQHQRSGEYWGSKVHHDKLTRNTRIVIGKAIQEASK